MVLRLLQYVDATGARAVAARHDDGPAHTVPGVASVYELAQRAIAAGTGLAAVVEAAGVGGPVDLAALVAEGRLLAPLDHPDTAHLLVTGTGLTHLGSAEGRDKMHKDLADPAKQTDSMRMFRLGLEGGKPAVGQVGAQPEWFFKGDGGIVTAPEAPLASPAFALDGGEEPEIVGLYVIGPDGTPFRLGYALGNEFSDHVTERQNYLYLAHSKLRPCSFGPELLVGPLPADIRGTTRIVRDGQVAWEKPFLSGEANMCHSLANLEHHHFKYAGFRRPGDAHAHYFGTATLSFSDGFTTRPGDRFEVEAAPFGLPLRNPLAVKDVEAVTVTAL
ncbi:AraD1 family protein [Nitrospirillum sp. BR 11164]|uniref:AraD1 family protein n=1 Tax=Nitrospirillum sp. BR 11164 TaxID=3104324 RepID=UPI002AFFD5B8|nr:AraD1 family protein [Nitrospirillum sp. BR 11164]MEA1652736.1 AraD1 family protein [Nitrospirillum sp. BR 11164]